MKILKFTLIGLLFTLYSIPMFGQTTEKEITDKFFSIYEKEPVKAVDYAFSTNKWFERKLDGIADLKSSLKNLIELCGEYSGYELLSKKTAGQNITIMTFIVKYDREPIRFTFYLYRAKDKWRVNNFSFDEDVDKDLIEAAKVYRHKENNE